MENAPTIQTGIYTIKDILDRCGITITPETDRRLYKVGGLGFDSTDEKLRVVGDVLEVTQDEVPVATFTVTQ